MKKITAVISLFLMFLMATTFALQAQDMARVTVNIKSLGAGASDLWEGKTEVYAKIFINDKIKKFPVKTGKPVRNLNWQFTTTTSGSTANIRIEAWEYDALIEGGDDIVCVDGNSTAITKNISTMKISNADFHSRGSCTGSGKESGAISYNITIEPTRTAYLIQGVWNLVKSETKTGSGEWEQPIRIPGSPPGCSADDFYVFKKNATYTLYTGADKCVPPKPNRPGTWSFQNNDTKLQLNITGNPLAVIFKVHWIDDASMILSTSDTRDGVITYQRFTYRH